MPLRLAYSLTGELRTLRCPEVQQALLDSVQPFQASFFMHVSTSFSMGFTGHRDMLTNVDVSPAQLLMKW